MLKPAGGCSALPGTFGVRSLLRRKSVRRKKPRPLVPGRAGILLRGFTELKVLYGLFFLILQVSCAAQGQPFAWLYMGYL